MRTGSTCVLHGVEVLRYRQGTGAQPGWCDRERGTGVLVCEGLAVVVESRLTWWAGEWPHMWPWLTQAHVGDRGLQEIAEPEPECCGWELDIHVLIHWWSMNWWFCARPSLKFWGNMLNRHRHLLEWSWHSTRRNGLRREFRAQVFSEGWRGSWERVVGAVL